MSRLLTAVSLVCFAIGSVTAAPRSLLERPAPAKLDGIVAVIGDEIVLQSELNAYIMLKLNSVNINPDSFDIEGHRGDFLQELIDGKVLLVHAKQDTTISVSNDEVDKAMENQIAMILKQNNWNQDTLESQLKAQGLTMVKFKAETRRAIRENLYKQKVQQGFIYGVKVNRRDVEDFYKQYKDSLPKAGESVLLSKLTMKLSPTDAIRQAAFEKIRSVKQKLGNGADFSALAKQYSESPEGASGGDLGFISKGTLSELVFEEKAFSLKQGEVSDPFETHLGFHIVKVIEKNDRAVHIQQIFIRVAPDEKQIKGISVTLDSIRESCKTKEDFTKAVRKSSIDNPTKQRDGSMGWIMLAELPADVRGAVDTTKPGTISISVRDEATGALSIYRVDERVVERQFTVENDYEILSQKTKDILAQKKMVELVKKWRQEIYLDVRL